MLSDGGGGGEPHFGFCDFVTSDVFNNIGWVKRETRQAVTVSSAWAWPVGEDRGHDLIRADIAFINLFVTTIRIDYCDFKF